MNCNRHHVSQKPCLIHYFEKLHLGGFLWIWELARGKTTGGIGWTGMGGQEARQPTHLSYWLSEGQSSEALCRQSQCRGERDLLEGCKLSPWVVVCQYPHSTKYGCCQLSRQPFQGADPEMRSPTTPPGTQYVAETLPRGQRLISLDDTILLGRRKDYTMGTA